MHERSTTTVRIDRLRIKTPGKNRRAGYEIASSVSRELAKDLTHGVEGLAVRADPLRVRVTEGRTPTVTAAAASAAVRRRLSGGRHD